MNCPCYTRSTLRVFMFEEGLTQHNRATQRCLDVTHVLAAMMCSPGVEDGWDACIGRSQTCCGCGYCEKGDACQSCVWSYHALTASEHSEPVPCTYMTSLLWHLNICYTVVKPQPLLTLLLCILWWHLLLRQAKVTATLCRMDNG